MGEPEKERLVGEIGQEIPDSGHANDLLAIAKTLEAVHGRYIGRTSTEWVTRRIRESAKVVRAYTRLLQQDATTSEKPTADPEPTP